MKNSKKVYANLAVFAAIALCFLQSSTFKSAGFQLLMSREQQKKVIRIITYIEKDQESLHEELNLLLYLNGVSRQNISLNEAEKNKVFNLSKKLASDFDDLNISFKSVYFAYGKDDNLKKSFDPLIEFRRNLNLSVNDIEKDILSDLYNQSRKAEELVRSIKHFVDDAELKNQQDIDAKIKEMSIWQWLFGY